MSKLPFAAGESVVYPLQGVGKIERIDMRDFKGEETPYYVMYLEATDMTIMVPAMNALEQGIRAIVSVEEAEKALGIVAEDHVPSQADWKARYQMNLDLLKNGSVHDIALVIRALYHRSKVKELPILERKLFDNALKLFIDEVSISLTKTKAEIEELIYSKLETEREGGPLEEEDDVDMSAAADDDDFDFED